MRTYVETNFVLALVLEQDGFDSCTRLLELAHANRLELVLPAFALYEANHSLVGKRRKRETVRRELERELREIQRSKEFSGSTELANSFMKLLVTSTAKAEARFADVSARLLDTARLLPLNDDVARQGLRFFTQPSLDLSFPDAVVYGSVMSDLERSQMSSCFVTTNSKDFGSPDIIDPLSARGCKTLFSFDDAWQYANNEARRDA